VGFKKFFKGVWKGTKVAAPFILPSVPGGAVAQRVIDAADQKFSPRYLQEQTIINNLCREWMMENAPEVFGEIRKTAKAVSSTLPG
jgi:hypothetical protein